MFGVEDLTIGKHHCVSVMGFTSIILPHLRQLKGK